MCDDLIRHFGASLFGNLLLPPQSAPVLKFQNRNVVIVMGVLFFFSFL
jgi:hypothetical protein